MIYWERDTVEIGLSYQEGMADEGKRRERRTSHKTDRVASSSRLLDLALGLSARGDRLLVLKKHEDENSVRTVHRRVVGKKKSSGTEDEPRRVSSQ